MAIYHTPVMLEEVLSFLRPAPDRTYLDGTLGTGGHAQAILEKSAPTGKLIGIDADPDSLEIARDRLASFGDRVVFIHGRYERAREILISQGMRRVDGVLLDLGISRTQLEMQDRGFSFSREDPLDMRMDRTSGPTAAELLSRLTEEELARILRDYGEERWARRIARAITRRRKARDPIRTTRDLVDAVRSAVPARFRARGRIHPATRSFQALRIRVNCELEALERFLADLPELLSRGGRCCILSFHSLEDRLVKTQFKALEKKTEGSVPEAGALPDVRARDFCRVCRKAVRPSEAEVQRNPLSRSARLRVLERC